MSTMQSNLAAEERFRRLSESLERDGSVSISSAAEQLGVSEMTIRRDLSELEERGLARRVRGGALALGPKNFSSRHQRQGKAKAQIAAKLAGMVPKSGTVALDASSTVMRLASILGGARGLTVVTNGPETFAALREQSGVTAILSGGQLDERTGSLIGPIACYSALQVAVDLFVSSAAGVQTGTGTSESTLEEAEVKRAFASNASMVVVAVDSSKLDLRTGAVGLDWQDVDYLVTELEPDDELLLNYRELVSIL